MINMTSDAERKELVENDVLEGTLQPVEKTYNKQELAEKIYSNSNWPVYHSNIFRIYDKEEAEQVTQAGREAMKEMTKNISEIWY